MHESFTCGHAKSYDFHRARLWKGILRNDDHSTYIVETFPPVEPVRAAVRVDQEHDQSGDASMLISIYPSPSPN